MNKEAIELLIRNNPRLRTSRTELEKLQPGTWVVHRSWGMGQIKDFDAAALRVIIDFEDRPGHSMDPAFLVGRVDILSADNVLVRYREDPGPIEEMVKKRPADLVVEFLSHCPDQAATGSEIERFLQRLLGDARAKKWWTATKKLLVKDPRVGVPKRKTDPYELRDEPIKAEDEVLEEFFETKAPKKKVGLAEKLIALSVSHADIEEALPDILKSLAESLVETKALNPGERLHGIWVRNDLARFIHEDVETLHPTSATILEEMESLSDLAEMIPASRHKRFLDLIYRTYTDTWNQTIFDLLKHSSGKFTNECVTFLMERGCGDQLGETLERWLGEQALKGPVLYWIVKNRQTRRYSKILAPLVGPRLFSAIFYAIDYEALQTAGNRRIQLADVLSDDVDLVPDLLADATPENAHDLATTLMLNQGFEELSKKSLLARFIRRFPQVQRLVFTDTTTQDDDRLVVSKASFEERKDEYEQLIKVKIPENKEAIAIAREHGDLRENAEYKMARQDQEVLLERKSTLEIDINRAEVTDFNDAPSDVVGIGSVVDLLQGSTKQSARYAILGAWDSNPEANIVSYQTPLARSLISKKAGDAVTIDIDGHEETWTLKAITRWVDVKDSFG